MEESIDVGQIRRFKGRGKSVIGAAEIDEFVPLLEKASDLVIFGA